MKNYNDQANLRNHLSNNDTFKKKKVNKNFKTKGVAIATTTLMSLAMFNPMIANATTIKHKKKDENEVAINSNTEQSPVTLILQKCTGKADSIYGDNSSKIDNFTGNYNLNYLLQYQFMSNTGKNYNISDLTITPNFKVSYKNSNSLPDQSLVEKSEAGMSSILNTTAQKKLSYNINISGTTGLTSSSTGVIDYTYNHALLDYNTQVATSFTVKYKVDGKEYTQTINANTLNTTLPQSQSSMYIYPHFKDNQTDIPIGVYSNVVSKYAYYAGYNFYYSLENYKEPKNIDITASLTGGATLTINPKYANDVTKVGSDTYQVSKEFFNDVMCGSGNAPDIFIAKSNTPTKTAVGTLTIGITPKDVGLTGQYFDTKLSGFEQSYTITFTPEVGKVNLSNNISYTNYVDNGNVCYKITGTSSETGYTDYSKDITPYTVLTTNGQFNGFNLGDNGSNIKNNQLYHLEGMGSDYQDQLANLVYYNGNFNSIGIISQQLYNETHGLSFMNLSQYGWYYGGQLKGMIANGEIDLGTTIVNGILKQGDSVTGYFNGTQAQTSFNTFTVGIFNNGTEPASLKDTWAGVSNKNFDFIGNAAVNGFNGYLLGSPTSLGQWGASNTTISTNYPNNSIDPYLALNTANGYTQSIVRGPLVSTNNLVVSNSTSNQGTYGMPTNVQSTISAEEYYNKYIMYSGNTAQPAIDGAGVAKNAYLIINLDGQTVTNDSTVQLGYTGATGNTSDMSDPLSYTVKLNSLPKNSNGEFYINLNKLPQGYSVGSGVNLNFNVKFTTKKLPTQSNFYYAVAGNSDALVNSTSVTPFPELTENVNGANKVMGGVNSNTYPYQLLPNTTQGNQSITITNNANNKCTQTVATTNKNENIYAITDTLTNNAYTATNYFGIGRIPTNTKSTLPTTYKDNGIGKNTDTVLTGINSSAGTDVYLIPKTLESKYNNLLNTQDISDLSQLTTLVNTKDSGLVKYTQGMNLSNYIGYIFVSPQIKQNETFNFTFDVKAEHQTPDIQNTLYSGFKYFDNSHNYGSISNINELDLTKVYNQNQYKDILNLSTNDGTSIPNEAKFKITYTNGKTAIISADKATQIIGNTGVSSVVLVPNTIPGYTVVTHNESQSVKTVSTNIDGAIDTLTTNTTNYVFHKVENTVTYKSIDQEGQIVKGVSATVNDNKVAINKELTYKNGIDTIGASDVTNVTTNTSSIPVGYKKDGSVVLTKTVDKNGNINWVAVQKLIKEEPTSITTEVITNNGDVIVPQKAFNGYTNETINYTAPKIPQGYKVIKITDNNNAYKPDIKGDNGAIEGQKYVQHIVWVIEKEKSPVTIVYKYGNKVVVPLVSSEVNTGSGLGLTIKIPNGYTETGITYNGKATTNSEISKIDSIPSGNNVIVELNKIVNTVTYKAIDQSGQVVEGVSATVNDNSSTLNKSLTNKQGVDEIADNTVTSVDTNTSSIPVGYEKDGNVTLTKTIDKDGDTHWIAVQKLTKLAPANINTKVITTTGEIVVPQKDYNGYVGKTISYVNPAIPKGYEIVSITDNGNSYTPNIKGDNGLVEGTKDTQSIVWVVQKIESPVSIVYKDGSKIVVPMVHSTVKTGNDLGITIKIPYGYEETGITYNNKPTSNNAVTNIKANPLGNDIVVQLHKIENTITYKAIDQEDNIVKGVSAVVASNELTLTRDLTNKEGIDTIGASMVTGVVTNETSIPNGYAKDGNVILTENVTKDGDINWIAVQKLTKLPPAIVTTQVQTESGEILVNPVTTTGIQNTKIGYKIPSIPKGYHLVNITENGNNYIPNKSDNVIGQSTPTHLIWIVAKDTHKYQVKFTSNIQGVSYGLTTNQWSGSYNAPNDNGLTTNIIPLNGATETWEGATAPTGYQQVGEPKVNVITTGTYDKVTTTTYTYKFAPIPKVTVTNIVELPNGKVLTDLGDSVSGYPNGNVKLAEPNIPNGYHLVKEPNNMPLLFPNSNVKCIWVIAKNEIIVHAKYVDVNTGKEVNGGNFNIAGKIENNAILAPTPNVSITPNKIPAGYREVGKEIFTNSENADKNQVINAVQKLEKIQNKVEYKAIDQTGQIVQGVSAKVNDDSSILNKDLTNKDGVETIADSNVTSAITNASSIPAGYKETGKISITPTKDSNGNITYSIVQHLIKLAPANVTTKVITSTGEVLVPQKNYTGYEGDTINYKVPKIPKGYKIIEVTDNGSSYTPNTSVLHPNTASVDGTSTTQNIVWVVQKENTNVTVKYMDNGKEIGSPITSNIKTGTPLNKVKLATPKGYRIVNIDVNGSIMKDGVVTGNALPTPNTIIVNLTKLHETINVTSTYNGKDIAGTTITTNDGNLVTGQNVVSKQVDYNSYKNASVNGVPAGYKQSGKMSITKSTDSLGNQIVNITVPLQKIEKKIKKGTITTIVEDSDNNIVVPLQSYTGNVGTNDTAKVPTIPAGYKIVSVTNNGKTVKGLPNTFKDGTQNVVWHVVKEDSSVTVKVIYKPTGRELGNPMTSEIKTGAPLSSVKLPDFDGHYKIVSINVNGKNMKNDKVTGDALSTPNEIIITIDRSTPTAPKDFTDKVTVKTVNGDILVPTKTTVGTDGTSTGLSSTTIVPAGWEVVNVTDNGNKSSMTDAAIENVQNENTNTIITVKKIDDTVTTKVIDENGNIIVPSKTTNVPYDSNINGLIPSVPTGYTPVKVVYNNKDYKTVNEIPAKVTQNTNVTIIVKKIEKGTITTKVITKDGQDLVPLKSYTGIVGTNDTAAVPTIPNGWKLVGITNNGKTVEGLPASYTNSTQNIVWIVEKIQKQEPAKVIVKIVDKATGQEIGTPVTTSATIGTDINSNYMPTIPTGYKNEGVTTDGVNTGMTPQGKVAPGTNNIIVYVNKKVVVNKPVKETVNAKVVEEGTGKVLNSNPTVTVNKGTPLNGSFLPTVPKGYKIDSITVNGITEDNGISGVVNTPTNIVITVSPIQKGAITVIVKDTTGNIIVKEKEATGLANTADTLGEPVIPNGYKIISITNNGTNCSGMPKDFTGSTQNIVYTVQKEATTVTTSVVTDNGVTLQAPSTVNAKIGVALDGYIPVCPKGYKVTKVEVNGVNYTNEQGVTGNTLSTPNNIIVYVTKESPIVPTKPNKPVVQNKGKITVTVETESGKILVPTASYEGLAGANDTASIPTIPAGYKIDKITNNEVVVNGLPKEFNNGTQNIVYVVSKVQKDVKITTTVETENGKILVNPETVTGKTGNATGLDLTIPKGYHLVKITSNNQDIHALPSKFGKENQNIIIIVEKDAVPTKPKTTPVKKETPSHKIKEVPTTKKVPTTPLNRVVSTPIKETPVSVNNSNETFSPVSSSVNSQATPSNVEQAPVSTNPKTGDSSNIPFAVGILGAIAGLFAVNKRKKKDTTLNKNS